MHNISPCSFTYRRAFHHLPKPPFSCLYLCHSVDLLIDCLVSMWDLRDPGAWVFSRSFVLNGLITYALFYLVLLVVFYLNYIAFLNNCNFFAFLVGKYLGNTNLLTFCFVIVWVNAWGCFFLFLSSAKISEELKLNPVQLAQCSLFSGSSYSLLLMKLKRSSMETVNTI